MPWVIGLRGGQGVAFGPGIETPSDREYRLRVTAALAAARFNRRHPNPAGSTCFALKVGKDSRP
jgi:hypothetical protein